jgi:hypothetical protein
VQADLFSDCPEVLGDLTIVRFMKFSRSNTSRKQEEWRNAVILFAFSDNREAFVKLSLRKNVISATEFVEREPVLIENLAED